VLGALKKFKARYAKPIEAARDKNASESAMALGESVNNELRELVSPYFLQRLKVDFLMDKLPSKNEFVVWTHLAAKQRAMYIKFLGGNSFVRSILSGEKNGSALTAITWLKSLCGHPLLVEKSDPVGVETTIAESAKLGVLVNLVDRLSFEGHRTLVFSQSTRMLDIIQRVLVDVNISRIDGQTKGKDRQHIVDDFNDPNSSSHVMLLSTKAAGVGLTLVGADRVIVYDPSWTPAEDSQAVSTF
jgi:SNF2 family DNA or RNA helicase